MIFGFHEPDVPTKDVEDVKHAIDTKEKCVILDVRTAGEYSRGKIQGSINLSVEEIESKVKSRLPDTKQKIYVYCLSGARSTVAVEIMRKLGYTNTFHMSHGLLAWRVKYFPVVE
jgi:rhodanese-related sulfurtransferase